MKSHLPAHLFPKGDPKSLPAKFIAVYRNPKDMAVSAYYHMNSMKKVIGKSTPFDAFMPIFYSMVGAFLEQIKHWWLERGTFM